MLPDIPNSEKCIREMAEDKELQQTVQKLYTSFVKYKYSYNFTWLGRPIIQYPQDIIAAQELIYATQPDLVIETGVAHGGSLILYASILELLGKGEVIGIDIEIRSHNRTAMEEHPLFKRITLIEGSSTDPSVVDQVRILAENKERVMVCLDSNHTHDHVLEELEFYSPLVSKGCYLIVYDTVIEDLEDVDFPNRPWGVGNNPKTAVESFLKENRRFRIDKEFENKFLFTVAVDGFLECIKD